MARQSRRRTPADAAHPRHRLRLPRRGRLAVVAFTQTDLSSAHVVARRIAGVLKNLVMAQRGVTLAADVTLATLKSGDTLDTLMMRVLGGQAVAAE